MRVSLLAGVASVLLSFNASAARQPSWYADLRGSVVFLNDYTASSEFNGVPSGLTTSQIEFDTGFGAGLEMGYRINPYLRAGLEGSYYNIDAGNATNVSNPNTDSSQQVFGFMANLYASYPNKTLFTPYVGAGAGMLHVRSPLEYQLTGVDTFGNPVSESKKLKDWGFGYQFMAGASYDLEQFASVASEIYLGYRYLKSDDLEVKSSILPGLAYPFEHESHQADVGLRIYF